MRDNRRSEKYFRAYLRQIKWEIIEYSIVFKLIPSTNQIEKRVCLGFIAFLYRCKTVAMYSAGFSIPELQKPFRHCIEKTMESTDEDESYHPILERLALAVLLNYDKADVLHTILKKTGIQNKLTDTFVNYFDKDRPIIENTRWCPWYAEFLRCPSEDRSAFLQQYLSKKWYRDHEDDGWYDSHKVTHFNGYAGYWAFEVAAIAKIFNVPDSPDWPYYPYDLVHYTD